MSDDVTVRLTDAGPARIRGNGVHWERGETRTVDPGHAEALVEVYGDGVEIVEEDDQAEAIDTLDPSELTVDELERTLNSPDAEFSDEVLGMIAEAEREGKNRATALDAIKTVRED